VDAAPGAFAVKWLAGAVALCVAGSLQAQMLQPELRVDVIGPRPYTVQPGVGLIAALGYYLRVSAAAGYALPLDSRPTHERWRGDVLVRATLDPFRQQRWALSLGGGVSVRRSSTYLAVIADLEGPEVRGLLPAIQTGFGGGFRAGLMLRRAVRGRR
jgi:hypothetical protein